MCSPLLIAALFTTAKKWGQPQCPLMDNREAKQVHPHSGILLSLKKEERQTPDTAWLNLEDAVLSEMRPSQKGSIVRSH